MGKHAFLTVHSKSQGSQIAKQYPLSVLARMRFFVFTFLVSQFWEGEKYTQRWLEIATLLMSLSVNVRGDYKTTATYRDLSRKMKGFWA